MNVYGIILAAGRGTRMQIKGKNKTSLKLNGKPLVTIGVELFKPFCKEIYVVVGDNSESVKQALSNYKVTFVMQAEQLGTGHATQVAVKSMLNRPLINDNVLLGYGDHLYRYTNTMLENFIEFHTKHNNDISLISTQHHDPNSLKWGRVVQNNSGKVIKIVEQKDATEDEQKITELNAGFYILKWKSLLKEIDNLDPSKATGEYYATDLVTLTVKNGGTVGAYQVPYEQVGSGINTPEQYENANSRIT